MNAASELTRRVIAEKVQDASFTASWAFSVLNVGIETLVRLTTPPDLLVYNYDISILAGAKSVKMPVNFFGRKLYGAYNPITKKNIRIVYRLVDFLNLSTKSQSRSIDLVALKGTTLLIDGIPITDTSIQITYLSKPVLFESEDDDGSLINYFMNNTIAEEALIHFAAYKAYEEIEDGIEGKKVNTEYHLSQFNSYVQQLIEFYGVENMEEQPDLVPDHIGICGIQDLSATLQGRF